MKNQRMRLAALALAAVLAGLCYSLSRGGTTGGEGLNQNAGAQPAAMVLETEEPGAQHKEYKASGEEQILESGDEQTEGEAPSICFIHICGEVVSPGVYELKEGSRVFQAVEMAGGLTEEAAAECINMAEKVTDGMKILIPDREAANKAVAVGQAVPLEEGVAKVNLNTASKEELMTLRGVGEARAQDIIRFRETHGDFKRIEDIMKVSGIKEAAFQKIKDMITV